MSSVMITCPTTGRAVSTAIETEPDVFSQLPNVTARMHCPACGGEHLWTIRSAWLADVPPRRNGAATPGPLPLDSAAA